MLAYEAYYLARSPGVPSKPYTSYTPERQSTRANAWTPEDLCRWDSFEAVCSAYRPNILQQLDLPPPAWNPSHDLLTPKDSVLSATSQHFYAPLNIISQELDHAEKLLWRDGRSDRSDCDANLRLADGGVIASGRMFWTCRASRSCACLQHQADTALHDVVITSPRANGTGQA